MAVGDDTMTGEPDVEGNHGLARSRVFWGSAGLGNSDIGTCNTFSAPAGRCADPLDSVGPQISRSGH